MASNAIFRESSISQTQVFDSVKRKIGYDGTIVLLKDLLLVVKHAGKGRVDNVAGRAH